MAIVNNVGKEIVRSLVPAWIKLPRLVVAFKAFVLLACGTLAAVAIVPQLRRRAAATAKDPVLWLGLAFVLSLIPIARLSVSLENSENVRYLYLPTAFVVSAFALIHERWVEHAPRVAGAFVGIVMLFQAVSLHALGWNWVTATKQMTQYRYALTHMVEANPAAKRFIVACVPDNHRGAFSGRNTTGYLVAGVRSQVKHSAEVLAARYVRRQSESTGCSFSVEDGTLVLRSENGRPVLTHPRFNDRVNPIVEGGWTITATDLRGLRASEFRIDFTGLADDHVVAVYDGTVFSIVELGRAPRPP
jgi:hypothetical protein